MKLPWCLVLLFAFASTPRAQGLADVVIAVDGSGSMTEEAAEVESALASFGATIASGGVDVHVIVVSRSGTLPEGICVPAPLGSGACPADEALPGYRHVIDPTIGSGNAFARILATYPSWSGSLRAGASRTIVVVSDDDSDFAASLFQVQLLALDPGFSDFRFDALVGTSCPLTNPTGVQYINLATSTSGIVSDLCNPSNIGAAFSAIASQVIGDSSCAPSCSPESVGDGTCDSACNVAACAFDAGDCLPVASAADVIIALDTSGSMDEEVAAIESVLASFAGAISSGGVDLHLVLISDPSVCAPAPLGSGTCPADQNLPGYRHVESAIESGGALAAILASYSSWSGSLRPGASRAIIVASDADADLSASLFQSQLLAVDPTFQGYRFHALVQATCPVIGAQYLDLAAQTSGVVRDLCSQDAGAALQQLAPEIVADTAVEIPGLPLLGSAVLASMLAAAVVWSANARRRA